MSTVEQAKATPVMAKTTQQEVSQILKPRETELLTVPEVARILRVDVSTVRHWIEQGALDGIVLPTIGKRHAYRIRRRVLERLLK